MNHKSSSAFGNLALEFVRVTEVAAIAAAKWIGRGDAKAADKAAVDAMRAHFNTVDFRGEIVIGEGAKDESHELYIGEKLGNGSGPLLDIAVDPLECTTSVANGVPNALTVIAIGPQGSLYHAADSYMQKLAVGPKARGVIDLDAPVETNIKNVAKALGKEVSELIVAVLDRPRHKELIQEARAAGARVRLFSDGDVAMALGTCLSRSSVDMLMGVGGSAEAVLSAAAMRCLGGELLTRWQPKDDVHIKRLNDAGVSDFSPIFTAADLAKGDDISFTATGVVSGPLADGVLFAADHIITHSFVTTTNPRVMRVIDSKHFE